MSKTSACDHPVRSISSSRKGSATSTAALPNSRARSSAIRYVDPLRCAVTTMKGWKEPGAGSGASPYRLMFTKYGSSLSPQ